MNGQSPDNLVLAQLAGIRTLLHSMDERLREHSARFTAVEARLGAIEQRLDIWNERMARIETRLGLREAGPAE